MHRDDLPAIFVRHAADILGDTELGLSGTEIIKVTAAHAIDCDVDVPHPTCPFKLGMNKRTALYQNLMAFRPAERYQIIRELCDHPVIQGRNKEEANKLKVKLFSRYGHLAGDGGSELNVGLAEETRHWLDPFPDALELFSDALQKYEHGVFKRNVLDDLRLSLEKLLKGVLENNKPLEKQMADLGRFMKERGGSTELVNMFFTLVDYYTKYQNSYVKHDNAVIEEEVEFILEITSSFMKHAVRLSRRELSKDRA